MLYYASTHPNSAIISYARDIILMMDTCADYLVLPAAFSLISGHYCFTNLMLDYSKGIPTPNGPVLTKFNILKTVVSSSDESETGGTFENAQKCNTTLTYS